MGLVSSREAPHYISAYSKTDRPFNWKTPTFAAESSHANELAATAIVSLISCSFNGAFESRKLCINQCYSKPLPFQRKSPTFAAESSHARTRCDRPLVATRQKAVTKINCAVQSHNSTFQPPNAAVVLAFGSKTEKCKVRQVPRFTKIMVGSAESALKLHFVPAGSVGSSGREIRRGCRSLLRRG